MIVPYQLMLGVIKDFKEINILIFKNDTNYYNIEKSQLSCPFLQFAENKEQ